MTTDYQRSRGQIVTFYSYKGGVGRSRALANTAYQLSRNHSVLCLDFDLEAPGLMSYFEKWNIASEVKYEERAGLIDLFYSYKEYLTLPSPLRKIIDWKSLVHTVTIKRGENVSSIDFIGPGRQTKDYGNRVAQFDWKGFYEELEGGGFVERLRVEMRAAYDYVLIDSRTGLSDTGGICSIQFPTILVVVFTSSPQSLKGLEIIVGDIERQHGALRKARVPIIPLPSRIDRKEETREYEAWFEKVSNGPIGELFGPLLKGGAAASLLPKITINYVPWYTYHDVLESDRESSEDVGSNAWRYKNLVQLIYDAANLSAEDSLKSTAQERIRWRLTQEENRVGFDLENLLSLNPAEEARLRGSLTEFNAVQEDLKDFMNKF